MAPQVSGLRIDPTNTLLIQPRRSKWPSAFCRPAPPLVSVSHTSRRKWSLSVAWMVLRTPPPAGMLYECSAITSNRRPAGGMPQLALPSRSRFSTCAMLSG